MATLKADTLKNENGIKGGAKCVNISNTSSLSSSRAPNKARLMPDSEDGTTGE